MSPPEIDLPFSRGKCTGREDACGPEKSSEGVPHILTSKWSEVSACLHGDLVRIVLNLICFNIQRTLLFRILFAYMLWLWELTMMLLCYSYKHMCSKKPMHRQDLWAKLTYKLNVSHKNAISSQKGSWTNWCCHLVMMTSIAARSYALTHRSNKTSKQEQLTAAYQQGAIGRPLSPAVSYSV